jgi:DNA-binding XRE family transcriptional regulator
MAAQITLTISDISIRQDNEGRYCLNDLHKAAGGEKRHAPNEWIRNQQAQELIAEISKPGIPGLEQNQALRVVHGGNKQGTFAVKELVYAYAMWISPKFHLTVIRAYDALVTGQQPQYGLKQIASPYDYKHAAVQAEVENLEYAYDLIRGYKRVALEMGFTENEAVNLANEAIAEKIGLDLLKTFRIKQQMMIQHETLAKRLVELRKRRGLTQHQLAKEAGVTRETIAKLETSEVHSPAPATMATLAKFFGVSPGWLHYGYIFVKEGV